MERVWYAAYGSNLSVDRFLCYLQGGCPPGATRTYAGARDRSPPTGIEPVTLLGSVYFAWESPTWGGGIAFYDPEAAGTSLGRAYLLTIAQFADLAAQEMHRTPGTDVDLSRLAAARPLRLGPGRYETLHHVGEIAGVPVVTFSCEVHGALPLTAPAPAYLATMARGLTDGHGLTPADIVAYLLGRPGIGPGWSRERLDALVEEALSDAAGGPSARAMVPPRSPR